MIRVKVGCELTYTVHMPTAGVFVVQPPVRAEQTVLREEMAIAGGVPFAAYDDLFGNRCQRVNLTPGPNVVRYDAVVSVPDDADRVAPSARAVPPAELPAHLLRFTLPSRYAETDRLLSFAWETFGSVPAGWTRARAICDWVRKNIAYTRGVSSPQWAATDAIARRVGVCRDRAHAVVALARAFNMPARYAVSYLPDIDVEDDGNPMDFHAYAEIWLEGGWFVFDPHDARARRGRVFIAAGLDAADAAFATLYGGAHLTGFKVWADPLPVTAELAPRTAFLVPVVEPSPSAVTVPAPPSPGTLPGPSQPAAAPTHVGWPSSPARAA